jgi:hypothetical protein
LHDQFDLKTRKTFLKRTHYPSVRLDDIFIGAKLTMCVAELGACSCVDIAPNGVALCGLLSHRIASRRVVSWVQLRPTTASS